MHNDISISNAQKMQFLKGELRGVAECVIQHLPINAENYTNYYVPMDWILILFKVHHICMTCTITFTRRQRLSSKTIFLITIYMNLEEVCLYK